MKKRKITAAITLLFLWVMMSFSVIPAYAGPANYDEVVKSFWSPDG